ncbi:MAG: transcription initiation factor TFIID subunit 7 [Marteilia pararefringens]
MESVVNFSIVDDLKLMNATADDRPNPLITPYGMKDREALGCSSGASPSSFTLEQHIVLRFLENEVSDRVREILRSPNDNAKNNDIDMAPINSPLSPSNSSSSGTLMGTWPASQQQSKGQSKTARIQINIDKNLRDAQLEVDGMGILFGRIFDLPNIIESQKTINGYLFHKSSNASQILICTKDQKKFETLDPNLTLYNHGITPPMHQVRTKKFRKPVKKSNDSYFVESEVKRLIMHDKNALSYEWEVINADEEDGDKIQMLNNGSAAMTETEQDSAANPTGNEDETDTLINEAYMDSEMNEKNLIGDISSSSNEEYTENYED